MVEYAELNLRLKELASNYKSARVGTRALSDEIRDVAKSVLPANSALSSFVDALSGVRGQENKSIEIIQKSIVEQQRAERQADANISSLKDRAREMTAIYDREIEEWHRLTAAVQANIAARNQHAAGSEGWIRENEKLARVQASQDKQGLRVDTALSQAEKAKADIVAQASAIRQSREKMLTEAKAAVKEFSSNILHSTVLFAAKATGALFSVQQSNAFNKTLIEANTDLMARNKLMRDALDVQTETGASLQDLAGLMVEIRAQTGLYGQDLRQNLTVASKLQQGLGASAAQVGALLNVSRQLRVSFTSVADEVANIVDKTSLSISDAVGLMQDLRDQMASFHKDGANLQAAARYMTAFEQSLREVGADAGSASRIVKGLTDMQRGGGMALAFGARGPDFATDPKQLELVQRNAANFLRQFRDNAWVFPQMAESFGLSAREAQNLIDAQDRLAKNAAGLGEKTKTLDERYKEQAERAGEVYGQLGNNLKALLLESMAPLTAAVSVLNKGFTALRTAISWIKDALPNWLKFGVAVGASVTAVTLLTMATWSMVKAFNSLRNTMAQITAMQMGQNVQGGGPGGQGGLLQGLKGLLAKATGGGQETFGPQIPAWKKIADVLTKQRSLPPVPSASAVGKGVAGAAGAVKAGAMSIGPWLSTTVSSFMTSAAGTALMATVAPLAVAAAAGLAAGYAVKVSLGRLDERLQSDIKKIRGVSGENMAAGRAASYGRTLAGKSGVDAARQFSSQSVADMASLKSALKSGKISVSGAKAAQAEMKSQLQKRIDVQAATIQREYKTAPQAKRDELKAGMDALVSAMNQLNDLQKADTSEYARINAANLKRMEAERDAATRNVTSRALLDAGKQLASDAVDAGYFGPVPMLLAKTLN